MDIEAMAQRAERLRVQGRVLRKFREQSGRTSEEFAVQAEIEPPRWADLEGGRTPLEVNELHMVATVLGVTEATVVQQMQEQLEVAGLAPPSPTRELSAAERQSIVDEVVGGFVAEFGLAAYDASPDARPRAPRELSAAE